VKVEVFPEVMLRDVTELRQSLVKETVPVLAGVCVGVTDHVCVRVGDGQMAVHSFLILNVVVNYVVVSTEDDASVAVFGDVLIGVLEIFTDEKSNSSVVI
jgi:hypothetical protein